MGLDPRNPTDPRPSEVESALQGDDGHGQFATTDDGFIRCLTCDRTTPPDAHRADDAGRLEGTSDPDDELMIVPLRCPYCGTNGTLTLGYGPGASGPDAQVLRNLGRSPEA